MEPKPVIFTPKFTPIDFWGNFKLYLQKDYRGNWQNQLFNNAKKYSPFLIEGDLSTIKSLPDSLRLNVMKSLSAYSKFSGCYEQYKHLLKEYGLKWSVNNDDIIIDRLLKYSSNNGTQSELYDWIRNVKTEIPTLKTFMDFTITSGLRFDEAINSYNLIVELSGECKPSKYYNEDRQTLEHFRYREIFIRRTKKTFMSFVPIQLINTIQSNNSKLTASTVRNRIKRKGLNMRFSDIRELYASSSVKFLKQPEIDFLQGRVSSSVFMQNYFNPLWIADLKIRALKNVKRIMAITG